MIKLNPGKAATPVPQVAQQQAHQPKTAGLAFIKTGAAAAAAMVQEEKKAEAKKNGIRRFWLPKDKSTVMTFLDGNLVDGMFDIPFLYEHQLLIAGSWDNHFICTQDTEPCPICEGGNSPSYVGMFTIIDHAEYVSKSDGKTYKDQVRLLVAKRDSIKMLQTIAVKRGGLRGCKFDVTRTGDKSPSIGSMYDFTEKYTDAQLSKMYTVKTGDGKIIDKSKPIDYVKLLGAMYMPAVELRKMGFGSLAVHVGAESMPTESDLAEQL